MALQDETTKMFIFLVIFWSILTMISIVLEPYMDAKIESIRFSELSLNERTDYVKDNGYENSVLDNLFGIIDRVPILKEFTPLLKILSFRYHGVVNPYIVIILHLPFI